VKVCQLYGVWWAHQDLNLEPTDYESAALTVELWARPFGFYILRDSVFSCFSTVVKTAVTPERDGLACCTSLAIFRMSD
jgi:hypothetical protein